LHKKYHLLIIDDEEAIRDMVQFSLEKYHFKIEGCADCRSAKIYLANKLPDLILLDWMLPDESGIEFAKFLRQDSRYKTIPIVMLTAKAEEANKVRGLEEAEVDDYVTKPFFPRELAARLRAVLRRASPQASNIISVAGLTINHDDREVEANNQQVVLTAKQFNLLYFFVTHADKVYTRKQLVDALATHHEYIDERSVDRQIKRLRDALQPYNCEHFIETVRGHGYKFASKA
jgi:two-component system phosphate regulon response regulator PhoB